MMSVVISLLATLRGVARSRAALHLEVLALRHQLQVLERSRLGPLRLTKADRWLWAWLSRSWRSWRTALVIVRPETRHRLASPGFPIVLDLEESEAFRKTTGSARCPR